MELKGRGASVAVWLSTAAPIWLGARTVEVFTLLSPAVWWSYLDTRIFGSLEAAVEEEKRGVTIVWLAAEEEGGICLL